MSDGLPTLIREATAADYPRVAELFEEMHGPLPVASENEWSSQLAAHTLCLECDGVVQGYVLGFGNAPRGHISQISVSASARGQGYGRALMIAMSRRFLSQGCTSWDLHVEEGNDPARRLYQSLGMKETHRSAWVQLDWSHLADLAGRVGPQPSQIRELAPLRDPLVADALRLAPGRLEGCRRRPGAHLLELIETEGERILGVAAYFPQVHLVAPLRAPTPEQAIALLGELVPVAGESKVRIVVDDQDNLILLLRGAGGEVVYDAHHMEGTLVDAR